MQLVGSDYSASPIIQLLGDGEEGFSRGSHRRFRIDAGGSLGGSIRRLRLWRDTRGLSITQVRDMGEKAIPLLSRGEGGGGELSGSYAHVRHLALEGIFREGCVGGWCC